ncbi:YcaO-like family protein [Amycolatopsis keratiniphila]|uniref:YcaO-like family protein n=1 Tax=Amycolatopsis keratiniphila TaxID=129921 RepID=UPI0033CF2900
MLGTSSPAQETKVFFDGTHRVRHPEQTWATVSPLLAEFGITRVADVTGLDTLGIPVAMAVRPLAKSLSVSQGKGQSKLLATISAVMEAIELWHAEYAPKPIISRQTPANKLSLPYRLTDLTSANDALVTESTRLDWVESAGMVSGRTVPVPSMLVSWTGYHEHRWLPPGLLWSSNGLASGNSRQEASLHALYEVVERDAVSQESSSIPSDLLDPASVDDRTCADLIDKVQSAGAALTISRVPSRFGIPCFGAKVWDADFPVACLGWGAHLDPYVAISRAVTEAVQSRLTAIAGSRDDLPPIYQQVRAGSGEVTKSAGPLAQLSDLLPDGPGAFHDVTSELAWVCERIQHGGGAEPLLVDLTTAAEFAVVKVILPGANLDIERVHPRR